MIAQIRSIMARSDDLRRANTLRILQSVRAKSSISRTELASTTGLSPATVSTIQPGSSKTRFCARQTPLHH